MQDAVIAAKLRAALGFDDVDDLLVAIRAMPVDSIGDYILTMLGDTPAAREIASLMGSKVPDATPSVATGGAAAADSASKGFYRKEDLDDDPYAGLGGGGKKKGGRSTGGSMASSTNPAASAIVGGARVSTTPAKPAKSKAKAATTSGLDGLRSALRPGRHPCSCNARRHALLYNCLVCGKVICEQEGEGPCLFCGSDPHTTLDMGATDKAAVAAAARFKNRLLEFDRTSAKRTTVIDDQEDYF